MNPEGNVYLCATPVRDNLFLKPIKHTELDVVYPNGLNNTISFNSKELSNTTKAGLSPCQGRGSPIFLGTTTKTVEETVEKTNELKETKFSVYNLVSRNCNHVSDEMSWFLCGTGIPLKFAWQSFWAFLILVVIILAVMGTTVFITKRIKKNKKKDNPITIRHKFN